MLPELGDGDAFPRKALSPTRRRPAGRGGRRDRGAIGIATLNALADLVAERRGRTGYALIEGLDAFDAAEVTAEDTVVVVGALVPFHLDLLSAKAMSKETGGSSAHAPSMAPDPSR